MAVTKSVAASSCNASSIATFCSYYNKLLPNVRDALGVGISAVSDGLSLGLLPASPRLCYLIKISGTLIRPILTDSARAAYSR